MEVENEKKGFLNKPIPVLYQDKQYIVFNKPAGLLVVPTPQNELNTLLRIVNHQYGSGKNLEKLYPCHRLDRETSGVILFAKGVQHQEAMMKLFKNRLIKKKYIAFVQGKLHRPTGDLRSTITDQTDKKFNKHTQGKLAVTKYKVRQVKKQYTVVEVEPITGRTNQIRIQFSQIGNPLVGDRKFSFARDFDLKFRRTALHAQSIECKNPITQHVINVTAPLPEDMEVFLARN